MLKSLRLANNAVSLRRYGDTIVIRDLEADPPYDCACHVSLEAFEALQHVKIKDIPES